MEFLISLITVACIGSGIFVVFLIMLQEPKSGGLALLGGTGLDRSLGVSNPLRKATSWLMAFWMLGAIALAIHFTQANINAGRFPVGLPTASSGTLKGTGTDTPISRTTKYSVKITGVKPGTETELLRVIKSHLKINDIEAIPLAAQVKSGKPVTIKKDLSKEQAEQLVKTLGQQNIIAETAFESEEVRTPGGVEHTTAIPPATAAAATYKVSITKGSGDALVKKLTETLMWTEADARKKLEGLKDKPLLIKEGLSREEADQWVKDLKVIEGVDAVLEPEAKAPAPVEGAAPKPATGETPGTNPLPPETSTTPKPATGEGAATPAEAPKTP